MQSDIKQLGTLNIPQQNKDIYVTSVLKQNALADICSELTSTETLDINVEKFLADMADNFLDTVLDSACQLAKHKKNDKVSIEDIAIAIEQNFDIFEPNKYTKRLSQIKTNEIKNISTNDHKKRLELTKEETKNVNI
jgi:transcription initiation factor TFIID subunit TAF12